MKKIRKIIAIFIISIFLFERTAFSVVLADEITQQSEQESWEETNPTETPPHEETDNVVITNEAELEDNIATQTQTGENEILEVTPTPTPPVDDLKENQGITDKVAENEQEGAQEINPAPTGVPAVQGSTIETQDAVSVVAVSNDVNTTIANSEVLQHTLNIFFEHEGDINLSDTSFFQKAREIFDSASENTVINVKVLKGGNWAFIENDIVSTAATGGNKVSSESASIQTGNAYSIASLFNKVNTTIVDSKLYVVTINIFGVSEGNIILPEDLGQGSSGCCGGSVEVTSGAEVTNNVTSTALSGDNEVELGEKDKEGQAEIVTGSSKSIVNILNIINQNIIGTFFYFLNINNLGTWLGSFLGIGGYTAEPDASGNYRLSFLGFSQEGQECNDCFDGVEINNSATVINNIASTASTGENKAYSSQAQIYTGNATSVVSLVNIINTTIIDSFGFIGFINIFGALKGDIGGASAFVSSYKENYDQDSGQQNQGGPGIMETGGQLSVTQYNNINDYVFPGDTVTFFVTIKNNGTGKVYDAKLKLGLIDAAGQDLGGAIFNLGDIQVGKGVKLTTGLVLSKNALPGTYIARAIAYASVGPFGETISAFADSSVVISGVSKLVSNISIIPKAEAAVPLGDTEVLGAVEEGAATNLQTKMLAIFLGLLSVYLPLKGYQKRKRLLLFYENAKPLINGVIAPIKTLQARITSLL